MGGRSNGCLTCKARRVKCDEAVPRCRRCTKAGVQCRGYAPLFTFVDEEPRVKGVLAVAQAQQHEFSTLQRNDLATYNTNRIQHIYNRNPSNTVVAEMPLIAFKDDIFLSYLVSKLFEGRNLFVVSNVGLAKERLVLDEGIWVGQLLKTSHKSLDALAAMLFGQGHHLSDVTRESRKLYGEALSNVRADLLDSSAIERFNTLAAVTALCMYEVCYHRLKPCTISDLARYVTAEPLLAGIIMRML
jgi:Fungal Zn(2)-Cys(6) binuclear cluster domain